MPLIATANKQIIYQGNTQTFELEGVQDNVTNIFWSSGTINMTLVDDQGQEVSGCIQVLFSYIVGSNGNFFATYGDNTFYPPVGSNYTMLIDGLNGASYLHMEIPCEVQPRRK